MSALAAHVTGQWFSGVGVCPVCGAPASGIGRSGAYCGDEHFDEARHRALAGEHWQPAPEFIDAVRRASNTERVPAQARAPARSSAEQRQ